MKIRLRNTWEYVGDDWWKWGAFLDDGGSGALKEVDSVTYFLHETFRDPVRNVKNPKSGFLMSTEGWGTFELRAVVRLKSGNSLRLKHDIQLEFNPTSGISG